MSAGAIALGCDWTAGRTRLRTVQYSGLSRISRGFSQPGGTIRVVASTLGPGIIGGDDYTLSATLAAGSALQMFGQMATPVYASDRPSVTRADWTIAAGATLCAVAEPLMMSPGANHRAHATIDVHDDGVAILAETVRLQAGSQLTMHSTATIDGVLALRDALAIARADPSFGAFGTVIVVAPDAARRLRIADAMTAAAAAVEEARIGFGEATGSLLVRVSGGSVWVVAQMVRHLAITAAGA